MLPVITFGLALLLSILLVPLVRYASFRAGKVAQPRKDRWHSKPTAMLGGVAIFLAFGLSLSIIIFLGDDRGDMRWGILAGSFLMFMLGLYDDFKRLSPAAKLVGQILAAAIVISLGYTTDFFTPRISNEIIAQVPNILLTFFWLVGITNAINLLDNMDGLAGGISLITAGFLSYFFWQAGDFGLFLIALALSGSILGFLIYNFPPASIFMGDSGSMFLGFTLAVLAIARQPQASNVFAVLAVPTLLFLLPILDTTLVTFTRILRGESPAQGGRDHASHRLIAFGLSERQAVLVLYAVAIISGIFAATLESIEYWFSLILVPLLVISLALLTAYLGGIKVGATSTKARQDRPITRIILELTFKRRMLEVILDFFLISVVYYFALMTGNGFVMDESRLELYLTTLPIAVGASYISLFVFGVYRGVWRYVGFSDLLRYFQAAVSGGVLLAAFVFIVDSIGGAPWTEMFSAELAILFVVFLFLGLAASRSSFRILDFFSLQRVQDKETRVLIYDAGDTGEFALRWILLNPKLKYKPVGFLDDDPFMRGRQIHGVEVLGGSDQLETILVEKKIDGVILVGPNKPADNRDQIVNICHRNGGWVRSLRLEFELIE